jgi:hypothetical protein
MTTENNPAEIRLRLHDALGRIRGCHVTLGNAPAQLTSIAGQVQLAFGKDERWEEREKVSRLVHILHQCVKELQNADSSISQCEPDIMEYIAKLSE